MEARGALGSRDAKIARDKRMAMSAMALGSDHCQTLINPAISC